ncbi:hypothetical protein [Streptomyces sp. NBC_00539]|uniref:hypothetical protein n=1 Tax=Streptomyces sp. NBC_00539 TaxID=2975770 RepID=UPI002E80C638|nr:hypothetical protein [Streptomyces sp. NBC_00539]WUC63591.1 hypothetical protein OG861_04780 [Streptomyces sp. NBC_00539]
MSGGAWGCAGAVTLLAAALVAVWWAAGDALPGLPRLRCELPGHVFAAVVAGFGGGQVVAGRPLQLGVAHVALLCGPWLVAAAVAGAWPGRGEGGGRKPAVAPLVALVGGFLVVGLIL